MVNADPTLRGLLKLVFLPNYNVSLAEQIIPAADLSEQISTAGMEASGTGNMKFGLNGALTIGTLDGANVEMKEHVGDDNIFIFGLTAEEVEARRAQGIDSQRKPWRKSNIPRPSFGVDRLGCILSGRTGIGTKPLVDALTYHDYFMVTADFESYYATQRAVFRKWRDKASWRRSRGSQYCEHGGGFPRI